MGEITAVRRSVKWSAYAKERIRSLWLEGLSAGVIGARMGATRNSIIGIVHRMGLSRGKGERTLVKIRKGRSWTREQKGRQGQAIKAAHRRRMAAAQQKPKRANGSGIGIGKPSAAQIDKARQEFAAIQARLASEPEVALVQNLFDLEPHHCRWPIGDGPYAYCGCQRSPGSSYCTKHLIRSKATAGLAKVYANKAGVHIDMNVFWLEELTKDKETVAA